MPYASRRNAYTCVRCKEAHDSPWFRTCVPCRIETALYHKMWRHDHIKRKLCTECVQGAHYRTRMSTGQRKNGRMRKCEYHHDYHLEYSKAWYRAKKRRVIRKAA